jgi:hypothetical protein
VSFIMLACEKICDRLFRLNVKPTHLVTDYHKAYPAAIKKLGGVLKSVKCAEHTRALCARTGGWYQKLIDKKENGHRLRSSLGKIVAAPNYHLFKLGMILLVKNLNRWGERDLSQLILSKHMDDNWDPISLFYLRATDTPGYPCDGQPIERYQGMLEGVKNVARESILRRDVVLNTFLQETLKRMLTADGNIAAAMGTTQKYDRKKKDIPVESYVFSQLMTSGDVFEIVGERMYLVNGPRRLGLGITQCDANSFLKWWRGNYTMKDVPDNVSVQRLLGKIEEFCLCWRIKDEDYSHRYLKEAGHQFACSCITFYTQLVCPATAYLENVFATSSATGRVGLSTNIRDPRPVYQGKNTNWQKKIEGESPMHP